jgi:hypothetical protein
LRILWGGTNFQSEGFVMLTENEVISAVCDHLAANGFKIVRTAKTTERGIDIVAQRPNGSGRLLIEAKGETSADPRTKRFGQPFKSEQIRVHVAEALYAGVRSHVESSRNGDSVALAFPNTDLHRRYWKPIKPILDLLKITTYFVQQDRSVLTENAETAH